MQTRAAKEYAARREQERATRHERIGRQTPPPSLHVGRFGQGRFGGSVEKENAIQHAGYENAVRALGYCMLCHRACRPQFCHADMGKGTGIKTDCRRGWPGCGPGAWGPGCHWIVGTSGQFDKQERRELEELLGRKTRAAVVAAGAWPARLPLWSEA